MNIPGLGDLPEGCGLVPLPEAGGGRFHAGAEGVKSIAATRDGKVELISFAGHSLAYVGSVLGCGAFYPVHPVRLEPPVRAVLMDLDGTTVRSEGFWIRILEMTVGELKGDPALRFGKEDLPFVSGHSVSEHLMYCIHKYCPGKSLEAARSLYLLHARREMAEILAGRGMKGAFAPSHGVGKLLLELKAMGIKVALVTSGLYEKAYPEILSAFDSLGFGDPRDFYDCIITAGFPLGKGRPGTLGELCPKPHPWLYAEACRVGLGIGFEERGAVVGIDDSGAGVCSIRLAGYTAIGMAGGNIIESGARALCGRYCETFEDVMRYIRGR